MVRIRRETERDRAAIFEVERLAFGRDGEAKLVDHLRANTPSELFISLVAEREDETIAGHALFSPVTIESIDALALGPVAVVPEAQNQGIGAALIRAGIETCRAAGHAIVVVVGHPSYYPRFGFRPAPALAVPFPVSDGAFLALELRPNALDGVRGMVHYPPAFMDV